MASLSSPSWKGFASFTAINKLNCSKPASSFRRKFRGNEASLKNIWMHFVSETIFFYGASKGNSRVSGDGGVIFFPSSLNNLSSSWGLGLMTNNQPECYSLLMAIQLAKGKGLKSVQIFGDSKLLIKTLNIAVTFKNSLLNVILQRIKITLKYFDSVESYHIL